MEYEPVKDELMNHDTHLNKQISVSNDLRQKLVNRSLYVWIRILKESSDALNKDFGCVFVKFYKSENVNRLHLTKAKVTQ